MIELATSPGESARREKTAVFGGGIPTRQLPDDSFDDPRILKFPKPFGSIFVIKRVGHLIFCL